MNSHQFSKGIWAHAGVPKKDSVMSGLAVSEPRGHER